jgi:hypothetical protein
VPIIDEEKTVKICSICGGKYTGWGNNAQPINDGRCCYECNNNRVIPARLVRWFYYDPKK